MNDPSEKQQPDLDRVFAHRGGFEQAMEKLYAWAIVVINMRSGPSRNGRAVSKLDAKELVKNALARLVEMPSLEDGEEVYRQLRRHIDNEVRSLQKRKTVDPKVVAIAAGVPAEGSTEVSEPEDCTVSDVADSVEQAEENEFYRGLLREQQKQYNKTSSENLLIDHILDGWSDRSDIAELMGITTAEYDILYKRVARAARELKEATLRRSV